MYHLRRFRLCSDVSPRRLIEAGFQSECGLPAEGSAVSSLFHRNYHLSSDGEHIHLLVKLGGAPWTFEENFSYYIDGEGYCFQSFCELLSRMEDTTRRALLISRYNYVMGVLLDDGILTEIYPEDGVISAVVKVDIKEGGLAPARSLWVPAGMDDLACLYPGRVVRLREGEKTFSGMVSSNVVRGNGLEELLLSVDPQFPRAVLDTSIQFVSMEGLKVSPRLECTRPKSVKIRKRVDEYYAHGAFKTAVKVVNGVLEDGYTAYLVAKMFGLKYIPFFGD